MSSTTSVAVTTSWNNGGTLTTTPLSVIEAVPENRYCSPGSGADFGLAKRRGLDSASCSTRR